MLRKEAFKRGDILMIIGRHEHYFAEGDLVIVESQTGTVVEIQDHQCNQYYCEGENMYQTIACIDAVKIGTL